MIKHSDNSIEIETKDLKTPSPEEIARDFFHNRDIKTVENKIEDLKQLLLSMVHNNDRLQRQFNELWDEKWKDNELQEMKNELETMRTNYYRGFSISKTEDEQINSWIKNHDDEIHNNPSQYHGCSGGGYEFSFYPTGLGTIGHCFCTTCKARAIREKGKNWYDYCKNELHGVFEFGDFG